MTCTTCAHWQPRRAEKMTQHGFGCCTHAPAWKYFSPSHTCAKHKPASEPVVAARTVWLARLRKTAVTA